MRRLLVFLLSFAAASSALAQQVTIQHGATLSELIQNLYGGDGIQLAVTGHQAHFGQTQDFQQFSDVLQKLLQARPVFPVPSSVGAISFKFNEETGTYEREQGTLGPILSERATTSGRGHANFALSYTFSDVENFNGSNTIPLALHHCMTLQCTGGNPDQGYLHDQIRIDVRMKLKTQAMVTSLIYGMTDRLDAGLVIPYIRNDLSVFTHAFVVVAPDNTIPTIHHFDPNIETPDQLATGHANGIGDIIGRVKYQLPFKAPFQTAMLTDITFPTGDKKNFLGTGDLRVKETLILSHSGPRFSPHLNAGYEFNTHNSRLNSVDYRFGSEVVVTPKLTFVGDFIGVVNPRAEKEFVVRALTEGTLTGRSQIDGAFGAKWRLNPSSLLTFNYLVPLNKEGIRPNGVITFGLQIGL